MSFFSCFLSYKKFFAGASVIVVFSIFTKLSGLLRLNLISSHFPKEITDSFLAAFNVPDFIFNLLILGALSTAFIPVFLEYYNRSKEKKPIDVVAEPSEEGMLSLNLGFAAELAGFIRRQKTKLNFHLPGFLQRVIKKNEKYNFDEHWLLTNSILNIFLLFLVFLCGIMYFVLPLMIPYLVSGFSQAQQELTLKLARIMLLSPIFFSISNIFGGVLQSFRKFFCFALAPLLYNLGIIFGVLFLVPVMGYTGFAWGVVLGAFLHLLIQMPQSLILGFKWRPIFKFFHPGVVKIVKLILPRTFALSASQINDLVNTYLASSLTVGSVSAFYYAFNLQSLPVGIFGVSLSVAIFPILSQKFIEKNYLEFKQEFLKVLSRILFIMIPLSIFMVLERAQIIRIILGRGKFDWDATQMTTAAFLFFAFSLTCQAILPLLARAFYARQNTKIPALSAIISVGLNIILSIFLSKIMGVSGLALAFSIAAFVNIIILGLILHFQAKIKIGIVFIVRIYKFIIAAVISGLILHRVLYLFADLIGTYTTLRILTQGFLALLAGSIVYLAVLWFWSREDVKWVVEFIKR